MSLAGIIPRLDSSEWAHVLFKAFVFNQEKKTCAIILVYAAKCRSRKYFTGQTPFRVDETKFFFIILFRISVASDDHMCNYETLHNCYQTNKPKKNFAFTDDEGYICSLIL